MKTLLALTLSSTLFAAPALAGEKRGLTSPGKPRAPLSVQSDLSGLVEGDVERKVTLTLQSASRCDAVETQVTARGGAKLTASGQKSHGALAPAKTSVHELWAQVPSGQYGELVVVATCRVGDQTRDVVRVFPFAAKGREGQPPVRAHKPLGTVETDETGRKVHILRSSAP